MEFDSNKAIYLQIIDALCDRVLSGELKAEDRIPSVREYGAEIGVNPNTVARSYEKLSDSGIIYNKRGIGYFIAEGAKDAILQNAKKQFLDEELPKFVDRAKLLGLSLEEITAEMQKH